MVDYKGGVTKAPSSIQDVYNFVAKFKVEKRSGHNVEYFNVSSVVSPDGRVATMRLTPAQPEYE